MTPTLAESAIAYAARGWAVFPLQPRGKTPITAHGCKDATSDIDVIAQWWTRTPNANIGIATGGLSGIVVIDIDGECGKESFEAFTADNDLPETLTSATGGGGFHLIFDAGEEAIKNSQGTIGKGIDTRGDGGYIVAPPSIHASGEAYRWTNDVAPAPLPDWLRPEHYKARPQVTKQQPARPRLAMADDNRIERARAYLDAMPGAIQGAGGHNCLLAAATALVHGFELADADALDLLWSDFNPRCSPPWDAGNPKERKDFERKVSQAAKLSHTQPRGWLADAGSFSEDDEAVRHGGELIAAILSGDGRTQPKRTRVTESTAWPAKILQPPGELGKLVGWINATAWKPQPVLALANAIAFAGAIMGRKVETETGLRTNIYAVGVARSGAGKDHSRKAIKNLAAQAGIANQCLGGEDVTSDAAIMRAVMRSPACLFQFDEIGHMIAASKSHNAATHQRAIPVMLTKLYSSANSLFVGKEYADQEREREDVDQPNACIYGTTVPSTFYGGLTGADIRDGFLGRLMVFNAGNDEPDPSDAPPADPPQAIVEWAKSWWERETNPGNIPSSMARPSPIVVPMQDDARALLLDFRAYCKNKRSRDEHESIVSLWARAEENARKLALIYACCAQYDGATIGADAMEWAITIVRITMLELVEAIGLNVSDSPHESAQHDIIAAIMQNGGTATQSEIIRRTRKLQRKARKDAQDDLIEAGRIAQVVCPTKGRSRIEYVIVD